MIPRRPVGVHCLIPHCSGLPSAAPEPTRPAALPCLCSKVHLMSTPLCNTTSILLGKHLAPTVHFGNGLASSVLASLAANGHSALCLKCSRKKTTYKGSCCGERRRLSFLSQPLLCTPSAAHYSPCFSLCWNRGDPGI